MREGLFVVKSVFQFWRLEEYFRDYAPFKPMDTFTIGFWFFLQMGLCVAITLIHSTFPFLPVSIEQSVLSAEGLLLIGTLVVLLLGLKWGNFLSNYLLLLGSVNLFSCYVDRVYLLPLEWRYFGFDALRLACLYYSISVVTPVLMGAVLQAFGTGLAGRRVPQEEAMSICVYSATPALLGGVLSTISLSVGRYEIPPLPWYLAIGYSIYVYYCAVKARFGLERGFVSFFLPILYVGAAMLAYYHLASWILFGGRAELFS